MTSQLDLDQGGLPRSWVKAYLGPSVGWVTVPQNNIFPILAAGTYNIDYSTSLVTVAANGAVIVILPSVRVPSAPGVGLPGRYVNSPITIVDVGGFAQANPITIQPFSGAENILGFGSIQVTVNFGGFTLLPNPAGLGWSDIT